MTTIDDDDLSGDNQGAETPANDVPANEAPKSESESESAFSYQSEEDDFIPNGARPFSSFEWMMASRYLGSKRRDGFVSAISIISFAGIMLGVAVLIVVMGVMNGFRTQLLDRVLGANGHIVVHASPGPMMSFDHWAEQVRTVDGVTRVVPIVEGQVMASAHSIIRGAQVRGIRQGDLQSFDLVANNIEQGNLDDFQGGRAVAVGNRLAQMMGLNQGDRITLTAPEGDVTPFGTTPRTKSYRIAATFEIGMSEYDASFIYMPLAEAQLYFNTGEGVNYLEIMVDDPDSVREYRRQVMDAIEVPARVYDWQQINSSFVGALQLERTVMFIILTMIILVASLNIVSGMIMLAKDKGRGIAVLRTMGATQGTIMRVFLIAGARIGVLGSVVGLGLGILFAANIEAVRQFVMWLTGATVFDPEVYFLTRLTAEINNGEVAAVMVVAITMSLLAPIYPAWRAARLDPVEALRYE